MKLAVSASANNLDAQLDPRFGRCAFFLVINPDDMSFEAFNNVSALKGAGAGIQSAKFLSSKGVAVVITGNCGPNAVRTLRAAGIDLYTGQAGTVREVVERFNKGNIKPTTEANVDRHYGTGGRPGSRSGRGTGRGMGGGMGGGRGQGGWVQMWDPKVS